MSILDKIFGDDDKQRTNPAKPDIPMQHVLDHLARLGGKPIETLSPQEARLQPTPTDAVKAILQETIKDQDPTLGIQTRDITIDGAAGPLQARIYSPDLDSTDLKPLVVYFHGGGFVIADLDVYDGGPRGVARFADVVVLSVHYRQAPETSSPLLTMTLSRPGSGPWPMRRRSAATPRRSPSWVKAPAATWPSTSR